MRRALLMCQGEQSRMEGKLGCPKQLVPFMGEPLLKNTLRLLGANLYWTTVVAPSSPAWREFMGHPPDQRAYFTQKDMGFTYLDALRNTRHLWSTDDRTMVLYGDVVFSPDVIWAMSNREVPILFAVRSTRNVVTGRFMEELYGFAFSKNFQKVLGELLDDPNPMMSPYHPIQHPWHLYHHFRNVGYVECELPVTDYTDDVDAPGDVEDLRKIEAFIHSSRSE